MQTQPKVNKVKWKKEHKLALVMALVPFVGYIIFNCFPLLISFVGLFCNIDLYDLTKISWNNFAGFKSVFVPGFAYELFYYDIAKYFYKAVKITIWVASTQLVTLLIALFIASMLREKFKGSNLFNILFFIPHICSTVAVALMWTWIFRWQGGILNAILGTNQKWLEDPKTMTWCIIVAIIWGAPGYGIVMYKAAFTNINQALYEAASIDGANTFQKFWHITLPGISPTTFFLMQAGVGAGLLTYDLARLVIPDAWGAPGGRDQMGLTLVRLVYFLIQNASHQGPNGESYMVSCACVISWVLFLVTGTLTLIMFKLREKSVS